MQVNSTLNFAAEPELVSRMLIDPAFAALIGEEIGAKETTSQPGTDQITTTYLVPVKALGLNQLAITAVISWLDQLTAGQRHGRLDLSVANVPLSFSADLLLAGQEVQTKVTYSGDLKIKIPFLGAKLEKTVAEQTTAIIEAGQRVGERWLANQS